MLRQKTDFRRSCEIEAEITSSKPAAVERAAAYIVWFRFVDPTATADQWLFGISPEGIGTIGMLLNFIVAITVSRFTSPPPIDVQNMVDDIRSPSGSRDA